MSIKNNNSRQKKYREDNPEKYKEYQRKYREANKDKAKEYRETNKDKINESKKKWADNNKDKIKLKDRKYRENNPDKVKNWVTNNSEEYKEYQKKYREDNKDKRNNHNKSRRLNDNNYRLISNIRSSIRKGFEKNGYPKLSKTVDILGCSFEEFKIHLESKFEDWMTWDNMGLYNGDRLYGWDLDHIIPISSAVNESDILKLSHYTNYQPLCSYENRIIKRNIIN
jgi:hypothetical protein